MNPSIYCTFVLPPIFAHSCVFKQGALVCAWGALVWVLPPVFAHEQLQRRARGPMLQYESYLLCLRMSSSSTRRELPCFSMSLTSCVCAWAAPARGGRSHASVWVLPPVFAHEELQPRREVPCFSVSLTSYVCAWAAPAPGGRSHASVWVLPPVFAHEQLQHKVGGPMLQYESYLLCLHMSSSSARREVPCFSMSLTSCVCAWAAPAPGGRSHASVWVLPPMFAHEQLQRQAGGPMLQAPR